MVGPIALTTLMGAISYMWLTVVGHPLWRGLRATLRTRTGGGWAAGLPLTAAMACLAAAIPTAACTLMAMAYPAAAAALPEWAGIPVGLVAGVSTWIARVVMFGMPRASPDVEVALALAVIALKSDDPGMLSRIEGQYERFILNERRTPGYAFEHLRAV
jgi:hypothetical protein